MKITTSRTTRRALGVAVSALALAAGLVACSDGDADTAASSTAAAPSLGEQTPAADTSAAAPDPTTGASADSSGIPGFSIAAVDAAADGNLETKPSERNDSNYDLPVGAPTPGVTVEYRSNGDLKGCTLGFVGHIDGNLVGVTAGHCNDRADTATSDWYPNGGDTKEVLGSFGEYCFSDNACGDYGLVDLDDSLGYDGRIAGKYAIKSVLGPEDLTADMELCKYGRVTGESCGRLMGIEGNRGRAGMSQDDGDSGSAVYAKNTDGTVSLVGILSSSPILPGGQVAKNVTTFTFAQTAANNLGLTSVYGG